MKDCFCMSLRTGGTIIAILELILSIFGVLFLLFWAMVFGTAISVAKDAQPANPKEAQDKDAATLVLLVVLIIIAILTILCVLQIIISSLLIHGIKKNKPSLLTVWLVYTGIFVVLSGICVIGVMFTEGFTLVYVIEQLIFLAIEAFFVKVIYDLREQIKTEGCGNAGVVHYTPS